MDARFKRHWATWHAFIREGRTPADFMKTASDETLVELLAYSSEGNAVERNIIATELTNRLSRLHRRVGDHSDRMNTLVDENQSLLREAHRADEDIRHETETFRHETARTSRYSGSDEERQGGW